MQQSPLGTRHILWMLIAIAGVIGPACDSSDPAQEPLRLQVALYSYVPRIGQFEQALTEAWTRTDVELEIVTWDGYYEDPYDDLDVFVFDAIYFDYFHAQGYLGAIPEDRITNIDDFVPYAIDGSRIDGTLYAVPQLGCASLLFYRDGDTELAEVATFEQLTSILGECTFSGEIPPENAGLMVGIGDPIITASYYLEAAADLAQNHTLAAQLPPIVDLDTEAMSRVITLASMSSQAHGDYYDPEEPWQRAVWFGEGQGRAMIGFTESLSKMGDARDNIRFRPLPLAGQPDTHLYYADLVGINSALEAPEVPPALRDAAIELADLLASTEYVVASFGPEPDIAGSVPQYIMPTRLSVFDILGTDFPLYDDMRALLDSTEPHLFRMGENAREWLDETGPELTDEVRSEFRCTAQ